MHNKNFRKIIIGIVDNQLKANDPPITRATYERLQGLGYSKQQAKEKIGAIVVEEIYDVMKNMESFDEVRYTKSLNRLM